MIRFLLVLASLLALPATVLAGAAAPVVRTGDASFSSQADGSASLTLTGSVTLASELPAATYRFEFGVPGAGQQSTPAQPLDGAPGDHAVAATLPMPPGAGVRYGYRLVVEAGRDAFVGDERAFLTRFAEPAPETCRVPDVRGATVPQARRRLRAGGCRLGAIQRLPRGRSTVPADRRVRRQHPRAGRVRAEGAPVDLVVR